MSDIISSINDLLGKANLQDVTSESSGASDELPEGYYLSELEKASIVESKSSHQPMIALQFKVVENGIAIDADDQYNVKMAEITHTANRKIFIYYPLKDESSVKRAVSDLLKFEDNDGNSLLDVEMFSSYDLLSEAIQLITGFRIYVMVTASERDGKVSYWRNLISWSKAKKLELPL